MLICLAYLSSAEAQATEEQNALIIEVSNTGLTPGDAVPARVEVDFPDLLNAPDARIDPSSIKLTLVDAHAGASAAAVPARFDQTDPVADSFHYQHIAGDGRSGQLVFQHTAEDTPTSRYRLTFELWAGPADRVPASPSPQIGDFDILRYDRDGVMSGIFHTKIDVVDWDGDGALDILAGDSLGRVTVYPGAGAKGSLDFSPPRALIAAGKPLDVGWMSAPKAVDWDGDGDLDLVIGAEGGRLLYVDNTGRRGASELSAPEPLVDADHNPIVSPSGPCPEMPFLKRDYTPVPAPVDYNGDGKLDLVLGGYVTGQLFYYQNVAESPDQPPRLHYRGVLEANGAPIDVSWSAAPDFADLDGDGDLDLVCGHIAERNDAYGWSDKPSLFFFMNAASRHQPRWQPADFGFPTTWSSIHPDVSVPRLVDWDGDGDLDAMMGARSEVFYFENVGSATAPQFVFRRRLHGANGPFIVNFVFNSVAPALSDLNDDGLPDLVRGGGGELPWAAMVAHENQPVFADRGLLTADDQPIYHSFIHGDDTTFPFLFDWDDDGDLDLICGEGAGYVSFYENVGTPQAHTFAAGVRFLTVDDEPLCVGPPPAPEPAADFEAHSGNRSVPAPGDYDGDGDVDLICSNAAGQVLFYRNEGDDRFAPGVLLAEGPGRCFTWPVDWDEDGRLDVVLSWAGGKRSIHLNRRIDPRGRPVFEVVLIAERMPWIPYPRPMTIDWNRDGDTDLLFASSYALLHFVERDFLERGYIEARIVSEEHE